MRQSLIRFLAAKRVDNSIAALAGGRDSYIGWMLWLAAVLLAAGVTAPVIHVNRLFIFSDSFSIIEAVGQLAGAGHYFLAVVIFLFSVIIPVFKIATAYRAWRSLEVGGEGFARVVGVLELIGKWSMLDVFIVAVIVVSAESSIIASAQLQPGLYLFAASILLSMYAVHRIRRVARTLA